MSRKRKRSPGGTAASLVIETLKRRGAVDAQHAVPISAFKDLPLQTSTLSYTIANLIEEKIVVQTANDKYWYDDTGFKVLQLRFIKGYSMIFIVPIVAAVLLILAYKYFF